MAAARNNLPEGLLADVKVWLQISWEDGRLPGMIASGISYLDHKAGKALDYTEDGEPRTLLMEYVRYARDNALDVFENNYRALLLDLIIMAGTEDNDGGELEDTEPTGT